MKEGLRNPALIATAIASTPQGQKAIGDMIEGANRSTSNTLGIVKNIFVIGILASVGYWGYKKFINSFSKMPFNNKYQPATISNTLASARAEKIYDAMYGLGNGFNTVLAALQDLRYNDFVKVYNAFGQRGGINPLGKKMTLIEWFASDEFNGSEKARLKLELPYNL